MKIKDWPLGERPRERLVSRGPSQLTDAELLAVLFGSGTQGVDAVELARKTLTSAGGLRPLVDLNLNDFCGLSGMGLARYAVLHSALEIYRRYLRADLERVGAITSPTNARHYVAAELTSHRREVFACLFLDTRHQIIAFETMFYGTLDAATVHPREVVRRALELNSAAVILAHNHPSGVAEPSQADRVLTRRLCDALALVDIRVIDHLIVGEGITASFAERGWL